MLWALFLIVIFIGGTGALIYLVTRFHKFSFIKNIEKKSKFLSWLAAALPVLLLASIIFYNTFAASVVVLHTALFFILSDLGELIIRKIRKKEKSQKYYAGVVAIVLTAAIMAGAFFCAWHVFRTHYEFNTVKDVGNIRVAMIADAHLGITLDGGRFAQQMERIDKENADVLIINGDFVDDDSKRDDMVQACAALGRMKTPVVFVWGNHDRGYYNNRDFTGEELMDELTRNGVTILKDEAILINDTFYVVGREDRRDQDRATVEELLAPLDKSKYIVTADHQPGNFDEEHEFGADLVLSGHTHGGHIWPSGYFAYWTGENDGIWGLYTRGDTNCVVTSGISGWAIPFKTGTYSEYVIIDVYGK